MVIYYSAYRSGARMIGIQQLRDESQQVTAGVWILLRNSRSGSSRNDLSGQSLNVSRKGSASPLESRSCSRLTPETTPKVMRVPPDEIWMESASMAFLPPTRNLPGKSCVDITRSCMMWPRAASGALRFRRFRGTPDHLNGGMEEESVECVSQGHERIETVIHWQRTIKQN